MQTKVARDHRPRRAESAASLGTVGQMQPPWEAREQTSFLLLMGCNAKKNLSSLLTVPGSVSLHYMENGLTLSLRDAACSWGIPVAVQLTGSPSLRSCDWLRLLVLFQQTL